ncbi:MAG: cytochrome c [Myxococcales bacterium]|nr:cytochrome c [Deltaproteobacteria bacterium]NND27454.1 cytochrome c [Myxococcales bacterium]MBT8482045.1 cytochrome c [Deltaproteobacteria bacterium]NNK09473.1 cytochrome c [Myxococcales bacterium]NNK41927.1 cytochrome c [Myxococcales bacterium]
MSTKHKTRFASFHLLVALSALTALGLGCGQGDSPKAPVSPDEYDIITRQQEEALEKGPMPIAQAMAEYGSAQRDAFAALAPQPSTDESALSGWSFKGAAPIAAGDVTMPPECVGAANPEACWGEKLSNSKGCMACHAVDGVRQQPCPNWKGLFGKERPLVSGDTVVADEEYLTNSIVNSWDQVVQGYGKTMPPYNFPEQELAALVAYLKSLGEGG